MKRLGVVCVAVGAAGIVALASAAVGQPPRSLGLPRIVGAAVEGRDLRVTPGRWEGARSLAYRWQWCPAYSKAVSIDGPIGWWRMGEAHGRAMIDASGYDNDGVYPQGVRLRSRSPLGHPGTAYDDTAATFGGTGAAQVLSGDNLQALGSGYLSIELWLRSDDTRRGVPVIAQADGNGGALRGGLPPLRFGLVLDDARTIAFHLRLQQHPYDNEGTEIPPGPIRDVVLRAALRARPDGWVHVVATHSVTDGSSGAGDGGMMRIYINGALVAVREESGEIPDSPPTPVWIGGLPSANRFFNGALDEVALYLRPLDSQRIQFHYRAGPRGCVDMPSQAGRRHPLSNLDLNSHIRVRVTATNPSGHTVAYTRPTKPVAPAAPSSDVPNGSPTYVPGPLSP